MELFKNVCVFSLLVSIMDSIKTVAVTGPNHGKVVVCYLGTWSVYRLERGSFTIEHLDPTLCTHVIYSFAGLDVTTDSIKALDPFQDLADDYGKDGYQKLTRLKHRYPHLKVSLAIGGWNEGSINYSAMTKDPARRQRFVASAIDFIRKYNFDGLDLDWEFPGKRGGAPEDKLNFLLLVKELKAAFEKYNFLLTAAFGAGKDTIDVAYDVKGLSVYLDFIHMMCYDYHGAWDQKTGANAPLRSSDVLNVEFSINYMLKLGANPKKLVMGVPLYGRTFLLPEPHDPKSERKPKLGAVARNIGFQGPFTRENGFMGYNEICLELNNSSKKWTKYWDSESRTPFAISENKVITYDDARSIQEKVKFAMEKEMAGIMVWSVDTDDFHGDCSDVSESGHFENFPLMRAINKAITTSLEEINADKENTIIHGNAERTGKASISRISYTLLLSIYLLLFLVKI